MSMLKKLKSRLPHEKEEHIKVVRTGKGTKLIKTKSDFKDKPEKRKTLKQAAKEFKKQEAIKKKAENARKKAQIREAIKYVQKTARHTQKKSSSSLITSDMLLGGSKKKVKKSVKPKYVVIKGVAYPVAKKHKKKEKKDDPFSWKSFNMPDWGDLFK